MKYYFNNQKTARNNLLKYVDEKDIEELENKVTSCVYKATYDYGDYKITVTK